MMREHGFVGRRYAGRVQQIITGSIGFDDWEWGVYLFSQDPLVFKRLVYEMRFDEASVWYGEFGALLRRVARHAASSEKHISRQSALPRNAIAHQSTFHGEHSHSGLRLRRLSARRYARR